MQTKVRLNEEVLTFDIWRMTGLVRKLRGLSYGKSLSI